MQGHQVCAGVAGPGVRGDHRVAVEAVERDTHPRDATRRAGSMPAVLAWIDLEMTGLDPDRHTIVEIASLVTDDELALVEEGPDLVVHATAEQLADMDDFVRAMHTRSGLLDAIQASTTTIADAAAQTLEFLKKHISAPGTVPLAGNSIGTDRRFLARQMPEVEDFLHYRSVDVSTVKELCRRWRPAGLQGGSRQEGRASRPAGHPRERARAGLLPRRALRPGRVGGRRAGPYRQRGRGGRHERRGRGGTVTPKDAPAMSIAEANEVLTAPGQMFEMQVVDIRGVPTRTWQHAPASLRTVIDMSLAHGDAPFLVYEDERTTFSEHYRIACTLAHRLRADFGVTQGDRVAIIMRNLPEWVMAFWGATLAGAVVVPLNAWWSGEELRYGLEDSGSKVAFVDTERVDQDPALPRGAARSGRGGRGRRAPHRVEGPARRGRASRRHRTHRRMAVPARARDRWTRPRRRPTSPSIPRTTPPSSTRRAPPVGPRVRWAPIATCART